MNFFIPHKFGYSSVTLVFVLRSRKHKKRVKYTISDAIQAMNKKMCFKLWLRFFHEQLNMMNDDLVVFHKIVGKQLKNDEYLLIQSLKHSL